MRAVPRSAGTAVGGLRDGALLVRVTAPPLGGAANAAVVEALAAALAIPRSAVRIEGAERARRKTVSAPAAVTERLLGLAAK